MSAAHPEDHQDLATEYMDPATGDWHDARDVPSDVLLQVRDRLAAVDDTRGVGVVDAILAGPRRFRVLINGKFRYLVASDDVGSAGADAGEQFRNDADLTDRARARGVYQVHVQPIG